MTRHLVWTASCAWVVLMGIVWSLFVPKGLTVETFSLLVVSGPVLLAAASALWKTHSPEPSVRQARATADAKASGRVGK